VLEIGIRDMFVLSGPEPGDFSCLYATCVEVHPILVLCCYVLLGEFERSGGEAGCFKYVGLARGGIFGW